MQANRKNRRRREVADKRPAGDQHDCRRQRECTTMFTIVQPSSRRTRRRRGRTTPCNGHHNRPATGSRGARPPRSPLTWSSPGTAGVEGPRRPCADGAAGGTCRRQNRPARPAENPRRLPPSDWRSAIETPGCGSSRGRAPTARDSMGRTGDVGRRQPDEPPPRSEPQRDARPRHGARPTARSLAAFRPARGVRGGRRTTRRPRAACGSTWSTRMNSAEAPLTTVNRWSDSAQAPSPPRGAEQCCRTAGDRVRLQQLLHRHHVDPLAVELSLLAVDANARKACSRGTVPCRCRCASARRAPSCGSRLRGRVYSVSRSWRPTPWPRHARST